MIKFLWAALLLLAATMAEASPTVVSIAIEGPATINSNADLAATYRARATFSDGSNAIIKVDWQESLGNGVVDLQLPGDGSVTTSVRQLGLFNLRAWYPYYFASPAITANLQVLVTNGSLVNQSFALDCDAAELPLTTDYQVQFMPTGDLTDLAPACDGQVLVANAALNRIQLIDPAAQQLIHTWQLSTAPTYIRRIEGTPYLFVAMNGSQAARVNLATDEVVYVTAGTNQMRPTGGEPGEVWMSGNGTVSRYNVDTLQAIATYPNTLTGGLVEYDQALHSLFYFGLRIKVAGNALTFLDSAGGDNPQDLSVSPDHRHLVMPSGAGNGGGYTIYDYDASNLDVVRGVFATDAYPTSASFRFDSKKLIATNGFKLFLFDVSTHVPEVQWNVGSLGGCGNFEATRVRWSPHGRSFVALVSCWTGTSIGYEYGLAYGSLPAPNALSVSLTGAGHGSVTSDVGAISCGATCMDSYDPGTTVSLTANAGAGSRFARWSGCDASSGATCMVSLDRWRSVSAQFTLVGTAGDLSGDGKSDLVWANSDGRAAVWLMNGRVPSGQASILGPGTGWSVSFMEDFDGDGKKDLVFTNTDGRLAIWSMAGLAPTATAQLLNAGTGWTVLHAADLDGDGKADLIFQHADGTLAAWLMDGTTISSGATLLGAGSGWSITQTGDFDGDGKQDLVFTHSDGRVAIWTMNGLVPGATAQILNAGSGWHVSHVADLDGDGKSDIVWRNDDGRVAIWLMNGTVMSSGAELLGPGTGWTVKRIGDFDGDGKADLLFEHTDGRVAIYLMNGLAPTKTTQILNAGSGWHAARVADLDGDGKSDIVWQNDDGRAAVWIMNGTTMSSGGEILPGGTGWGVSTVSQP